MPIVPPAARHLYVHVPFCAHKCEYCAFYSEAAQGELINRYVDALATELRWVPAQERPRTVFFGGGTPSLLNLRQWQAVLDVMRETGWANPLEWTVECNPATVSLEKARLLREHGVNRVSMGVQSLDEGLLDRLGRVHSRDMAFRSFDVLRQAGFENVNVDLMFAIPGQTRDMWRRTIEEALALGSEHLSCYEVIYEEDTALYAQLNAGEFAVDEDLACDMYDMLIDTAGAAGFAQYEVANFARRTGMENDRGLIPSRACAHNVNYWRGGDFHGLGPSATGYFQGVRTKNWANTQLYCERIEAGHRPIESTERLAGLARAGEIAAFGLRMNAGWPHDTFRAVTGFDLRRSWGADMDVLIGRGYAVDEGGVFRLTRAGLRYADYAAELFLRPGDNAAAEREAGEPALSKV